MAYDERLAERVRQMLTGRRDEGEMAAAAPGRVNDKPTSSALTEAPRRPLGTRD